VAAVLGIHNGHHASCAIVRDGVLVAGIEQERVTRRKGDGGQGLSNRLPIRECLRAAGASLRDLDLIVSSFQAIGPGGAGLTQPIVESGFDLFDPFDPRHEVISHHYGHALSALGSSGFKECAILVCDLAGSTTRDGEDFAVPFADFVSEATTLGVRTETKTECLSIYHADERRVELRHREFCIPHSAPEVFVYSPASLYDNVSRMVFGKENAHGELMALASVASGQAPALALTVEDILDTEETGAVRFKNGWQSRVNRQETDLQYAPLASIVQEAFQRALLRYAKLARTVVDSDKLAAAGGVFLNIVANSAIGSSGLFEQYFVPSSPHDAGIAVGCAYHGWRAIAKRSGARVTTTECKAPDRIGTSYSEDEMVQALRDRSHLVSWEGGVRPEEVAGLLRDGQIAARFGGRAEFGPRALGGRSLLATPLDAHSKDRLNLIKGRQPWRPVAPVVLRDRVGEFFTGPTDSPYMNMVHGIAEQHRGRLTALSHPDGSARAQTLTEGDDPFLYEVIRQFGLLTGYPILVNTSLNGPGDPIAETPEKALDFFLASEGIVFLVLGDNLVRRTVEPSWDGTRLAPDVIVSTIRPGNGPRFILLRRGRSMEVSKYTLRIMERLLTEDVSETAIEAEVCAELRLALFQQFLIRR
jgi:carbamoyltransferase